MKIDIIHISSTFSPKEHAYNDCIIIYDDRWNDYGYETLFHMVYYDNNGKKNDVGMLKIHFSEYDSSKYENKIKEVRTIIGRKIEQLSQLFCSLGYDLEYYKKLKTFFPESYLDILKRLNDIAIFDDIRKKYINSHGVKVSLLRESSAEKALNEAAYLLKHDTLEDKNMSFAYNVKLPYSNTSTKLQFDFSKVYNDEPNRINILIGKNGVGKTNILTNLANSLSGIELSEYSFENKRPPVYKILSISYSAFDDFKKRDSLGKETLGSYVYCGIQSKEGTLSLKKLHENMVNALHIIASKERMQKWETVMSELLEKEHVSLISKLIEEPESKIQLSSGQNILVCTITEALANIEQNSILLFDEPELHLHPNAVSNVMRMLYRLLEEFDSYAIFATHSPLIIQETPSKYIQILDRIDDTLYVRKPILECFGENITSITEEIFDVKSTESNYKTILKKLSKEKSFEEIMELFDDNLSMNALIYLKNCCRGGE